MKNNTDATHQELNNILRGKSLFKYLFDQEVPNDFPKLLEDFRNIKTKGSKPLGKNPDMRAMKARLADMKAGIDPNTPMEAPWKLSKLLLHVTEYHCICCGTKTKAPDSPILIQFVHPRRGTKTELANGRGIDLPRQIIYSFRETAGCHLCFDLETMIEQILDSYQNRKEDESDLFSEKNLERKEE